MQVNLSCYYITFSLYFFKTFFCIGFYFVAVMRVSFCRNALEVLLGFVRFSLNFSSSPKELKS